MPWKPPDEWEGILRGEECPLCKCMHLPRNDSGSLIARLSRSWVRLPFNQHAIGWVVVTLDRHATELYQLSTEELAGFWQNVAAVASALDIVLNPVKINYLVYGNVCPHIHCHLLPRFSDHEPTPQLFIDMEAKPRHLPHPEYEKLLERLQSILAEQSSPIKEAIA